ncbi:MAG: hypothetical protein MEEGG_00721 [Eggerthella lenta]
MVRSDEACRPRLRARIHTGLRRASRPKFMKSADGMDGASSPVRTWLRSSSSLTAVILAHRHARLQPTRGRRKQHAAASCADFAIPVANRNIEDRRAGLHYNEAKPMWKKARWLQAPGCFACRTPLDPSPYAERRRHARGSAATWPAFATAASLLQPAAQDYFAGKRTFFDIPDAEEARSAPYGQVCASPRASAHGRSGRAHGSELHHRSVGTAVKPACHLFPTAWWEATAARQRRPIRASQEGAARHGTETPDVSTYASNISSWPPHSLAAF